MYIDPPNLRIKELKLNHLKSNGLIIDCRQSWQFKINVQPICNKQRCKKRSFLHIKRLKRAGITTFNGLIFLICSSVKDSPCNLLATTTYNWLGTITMDILLLTAPLKLGSETLKYNEIQWQWPCEKGRTKFYIYMDELKKSYWTRKEEGPIRRSYCPQA